MIKFHYFGDLSKAKTNVITVASELLKDPAGKFHVDIAYSFSNELDVFNKHIGKQIAVNRLKKQSTRLSIGDYPVYHEINKQIAEYILSQSYIESGIPAWTINILKEYV